MNDFTIPKKQYVLLEEGQYLAEVTDLEQSEGEYGTQVKITFNLLDAEEENASLIGWCSANYSPKSKLFAWTKAALGQKFNPDEDFQASKLKGKQVHLQVSRRMGANGTEYNKVEAVFSHRQALPRKAEEINAEIGFDEVEEPPAPPVWDE